MVNFKEFLIVILFLANQIFSQSQNDFFLYKENKFEYKIYFSKSTIKQEAERKIILKKVKKLFEIGGMNDTILFSPSTILSDKNDNFYVLDYVGKFVRKFDKNGKFIKQFGKNGKGPAEFVYPASMYIDSLNNLYVFDDKLWKIVIFKNKKTTEFRTIGGLYLKFLPINQNKIVAFEGKANSLNFLYAIDSKGKELFSYENFLVSNRNLKNFPLFSSFLIGDLMYLTKNRFVFIPNYFNKMIFYNGNKIEKIISTIDKDSKPEFNLTLMGKNVGVNFNDFDKYMVNLSSFYINNKIYVLSNANKNSKGKIIFDVYDSLTGKYNFSLGIPIKGQYFSLHLSQNRIYVLTDEFKIRVYSYE